MLAIKRRNAIAELLASRGKVIVSELSREFSVTEETIRRDLERLEKEGIARDFVRMIQNLRKEKDLDVSDRIIVRYEANTGLIEEALSANKDYIMDQVLALDIISNQALENAPVNDEIGDGKIALDLEKA